MELKEYFKKTDGIGILATADEDGRVDVAIYSKPYVSGDGKVVFIMGDRLTRKNLKSNPHAAYLFMESGPGFSGKRLFMTMERESTGGDEQDSELRDWYKQVKENYPDEGLYLGYFRIYEVLPLVMELQRGNSNN
jgi:hypothetical protein